MRRFLSAAAFICIAAFWGTTSSAQGIPQGTYQQTCNNVSVSGDTLIANCQDANGTWRNTQLPGFQRCSSEISNDNGNLRCANAGPGPAQHWRGNGPDGSYINTCRDVKTSGDDLHAKCQTNDGAWRSAKLDDYQKCKGDIVNDNGKLHCVAGAPYGAGPVGAYGAGGYNNNPQYQNTGGPAGTYGQSCRDIHVGGDDLHARCQTRAGDWVDAKLDDFQKCHGDIVNDDGHLRCVAGAPVGGGYYGNGPAPVNGGYYGGANGAVNGPAGSYTRTCMDIHAKGDDLHARCQTSSGELHDTKLDDYQKCHSDIINDDGNLRCQR